MIKFLKRLSSRQMFGLFIAVGFLLTLATSELLIAPQTDTALLTAQNEASEAEVIMAGAYLKQYLEERESILKQVANNPALQGFVLGSAISKSEIRDQITTSQINDKRLQINLVDFSGELIYQEFELTLHETTIDFHLKKALNDKSPSTEVVVLSQLGNEYQLLLLIPITYSGSVEGALLAKLPLDLNSFYASILETAKRQLSIVEPNAENNLESTEFWHRVEYQLPYSGLALSYGIDTTQLQQRREALSKDIALATVVGFICAFALLYLLGYQLILNPYKQLELSRLKLARNSKLLRESEAQARTLAKVAEHAKDSIIITNPDGRVSWANEASSKLSGYSFEEFVGQKPGHLLQGKDSNPETIAEIAAAVKAQQHIRRELLNYNKDGHSYWIDIDISPIFDATGELESFIAVERETTEQRRLQQKVAEALSKAETASQAKSQFLANMSHEIRTPMNGVLGLAQLLIKTPLNEEQSRYLHSLQSSGQHMMDILNDILDVSKIEQGKLKLDPHNFCLEQLTDNLFSSYASIASEKSLEFTVNTSIDKNTWYFADASRIRQILLNLINNALKFTEVGSITIFLSQIQTQQTTSLQIEVADTGIGIDQDRLTSIFEPFNQGELSTTRRYGGTGLGLSIIKQLVQLFDGRITVHSELGKGSSFMVTLPIELASAQKTQAIVEAEQTLFKGAKALVVEDNRVNAMILSTFLEKRGMQTRVAVNGLEALAAINEQQFDVIFMDNHMPKMDGIEATRLIRKLDSRSAKTPIIACTADAYADSQNMMLESGVNYVLTKPLSETELDFSLQKYLAEFLEVNDSSMPVEGNDAESKYDVKTQDLSILDIEQLRSVFSQDNQLVSLLLQTFWDEFSSAGLELTDAYQATDFERLTLISHSLKGSSASLYALALNKIATSVEKQAREQQLPSSDLLDELVKTLQQTLDEVRLYLKNH
ncbi:response regulator [Alginatibacterium sediminis]|uniref:Sensory/regulatory protein RpfC n=1 Tax=Alginatibacterium sediminis TaxID=2164068 RepID=A0A420E6J0_9ALTE|nr:hybrid sensor histidine kinase/response regulator [Alginatibacterium sediminis]RKF14250.1 response regulator [Alginatibacterium sediminis]